MVHELLSTLSKHATVLDIGSCEGSFDTSAYSFLTVQADLQPPSTPSSEAFVQADAASLPFAPDVFDAVISNHSLEHFTDLKAVLQEFRRTCKPQSSLYVAVPDCTTLTDILYRWLAHGGGHVNGFPSANHLASMIEKATGLSHKGTRPLCSSLSFLNSKNRKAPPPRKLLLLGNGREGILLFLNWLFRLSDRFFSTRLSRYGWALYFGEAVGAIDESLWINVCVRCGAGHPSDWLLSTRSVHRKFLVRSYNCPSCNTTNIFFKDRASLVRK